MNKRERKFEKITKGINQFYYVDPVSSDFNHCPNNMTEITRDDPGETSPLIKQDNKREREFRNRLNVGNKKSKETDIKRYTKLITV